ncbi:hypothetical protein [Hymenobacter sp.]|uniref:hypothetical protein n=1 Tax=Hymenobacter sp. TaxID=1898978 RepID=UPI002EDBA34B
MLNVLTGTGAWAQTPHLQNAHRLDVPGHISATGTPSVTLGSTVLTNAKPLASPTC